MPLVIDNSPKTDSISNSANVMVSHSRDYNNDNSNTNNETVFNSHDDLLKHVSQTTTEVDPSVKICQFNSGNDRGITATCLNALALLDINDGNQFLQQLTQKLKSNMVSIKNDVASVDPHELIKEVIDELGDNMFPETIPNQMKSKIKNDLLGNAKNPVEFIQSLAKISGMEKNNDFAKIIKRFYNTTTGEKLVAPQVEWTNPVFKLNYRENFSYFQNRQFYGREEAEKKLFTVDSLEDLIEQKNLSFEDYEFNRKNWNLDPIQFDFPRKAVMISFEDLLPISSINLLEDWKNSDYMFNFYPAIKDNGIGKDPFYFELSAIICYNAKQKDLFESTSKSIPTDRKFSTIIYNNSAKNFTIIDDLDQKETQGYSCKYVNKKSLHNLFKIDNDNYRIPLMAFLKRVQK